MGALNLYKPKKRLKLVTTKHRLWKTKRGGFSENRGGKKQSGAAKTRRATQPVADQWQLLIEHKVKYQNEGSLNAQVISAVKCMKILESWSWRA